MTTKMPTKCRRRIRHHLAARLQRFVRMCRNADRTGPIIRGYTRALVASAYRHIYLSLLIYLRFLVPMLMVGTSRRFADRTHVG